jgi:hypothetical protein
VTDRIEAQAALATVLLARVRRDPFPSSTQMDILEQTLPPQLYDQYLNALLEKVAGDQFPSIPLIHRIRRFAERIPA